MDTDQWRQEYEMLVNWEIENFKDSATRRELLEIGDIAVGELKQAEYSSTGYDEIVLWAAVDRVIRRQLRIPSYTKWLRGQRIDRKRNPSTPGTIGVAPGKSTGIEAAPDLPGFERIAGSREIALVNDQLLALVARKPDLIHSLSARRFEELIAEILETEGFQVELTSASRDGGRDILARTSSRLGPALILVECKKYRLDRPVGVAVVRALYGTVLHERATSGVLVTTSTFTRGAHEFQRAVPYQLTLRDYRELGEWLADIWPPSEESSL